MSIDEHLKDIDFRSREVRSENVKEEFIGWYNELIERMKIHGYSDRLDGQLTMITSVLWHLLDKKEFKKLRKLKD